MKLRNNGASNIEKEKGILVFGFETAYVNFDEETKKKLGPNDELMFGVEGKSVYSPIGDEEFATINAQAKKEGMKSLRENGLIKALAGLTTLEEVIRVTAGEENTEE